MKFEVVVFTAAVIFLSLPSDAQGVPPEGFIVVKDKNYFVSQIVNMELSQSEAASFCSDLGMELPDLSTPQKEKEISFVVASQGWNDHSFWTSGLRGSDGRWMWTNLDQEFQYTHWLFEQEPRPGDDAVFNDNRLGWLGNPPSYTMTFVCQEVTQRVPPIGGSYMIIGSQLFFIFLHSEPVNQAEASSLCANRDMELPDLSTPAKEKAVVDGIWSHRYGLVSNFLTSGVRGPLNRWRWTNLGKDMTYLNFEQGLEPAQDDDVVLFLMASNSAFSWRGVGADATSDRVLCQMKKPCYQTSPVSKLHERRTEF